MSNPTVRAREFFEAGKSAKILFALFLLALILRLLFLGNKSFWLDEANSLRVAQAGQAALWAGRSEAYHPPMFYWLLEWWMQVAQGELLLRLPAALFGSLAVLLAYVLAADLLDRRVGLTAAALVALSPLLVWYSQELRPYALLGFLGLLAMIAATRLFLRRSVAWWPVFVAATAAAMYVQYVAVLLLPLEAVLFLALLAADRTSWRAGLLWLTGCAAAIGAYSPWLQTPSFRQFLRLSISEGNYVYRLFARAGLSLDLTGFEPAAVAILAACGLAAFWALYRLFRWLRARRTLQGLAASNWVMVLLVIFFLGLLVASVYPRGYSIKRQLVLFWPFGLVLLAWFWPWQKGRRAVLASVLACSMAAALVNVALVPKTQWREATAFVDEHAGARDIVLLEPSYMSIPFDYYNARRDDRKERTGAADPSQLETLLAGHPRVWFVSVPSDLAYLGQTQAWLESHAVPLGGTDFYGVRVRLYDVGSSGG